MADPRLKQIKIKTGVCKRLTKEKSAYEKEAEQMNAKVEKMKSENQDEYMIKKQVECLMESRAMIPDCLRRLGSATEDLQKTLDDAKDLGETEDYKTAQTVVEEAQKVIKESE